jgi:hypothetical protein
MAEGSHRPGGEPPRRSEQDLLADRRARRESESADAALVRRAEVAEATVQTLETHLASLQQRVRDAEEESRRMVDLIETERASLVSEPGPDGPGEVVLEYELRRARQRAHVERQLRIEAEDRYADLERESRAEIDRLLRRLSTSERDAQELGARLETLERELLQAQQAASRGIDEQARAELYGRLRELERSAVEIQQGLESERAARARSEQLLEAMHESHRQVQALVGDLRSGFARLSAALAARAGSSDQALAVSTQAPAGEMADALAAAVVRLRERAEEGTEQPKAPPPAAEQARAAGPGGAAGEGGGEPQTAPVVAESAVIASHGAERETAGAPALKAPTHKHSLSLIGRLRLARKQRRVAP